jgi:hypothetical protein
LLYTAFSSRSIKTVLFIERTKAKTSNVRDFAAAKNTVVNIKYQKLQGIKVPKTNEQCTVVLIDSAIWGKYSPPDPESWRKRQN